jgi:hypothetical protein
MVKELSKGVAGCSLGFVFALAPTRWVIYPLFYPFKWAATFGVAPAPAEGSAIVPVGRIAYETFGLILSNREDSRCSSTQFIGSNYGDLVAAAYEVDANILYYLAARTYLHAV